MTGTGFFKDDGLLYQCWLLQDCSDEEMAVEQLVLLKEFRKMCRGWYTKSLQLVYGQKQDGPKNPEDILLATILPGGGCAEHAATARRLEDFGGSTDSTSCAHANHHNSIFEKVAMGIIGPSPKNRYSNRYMRPSSCGVLMLSMLQRNC